MPRRRTRRRSRRPPVPPGAGPGGQVGTSLVEVLVALAVLALAVLFTVALVLQQGAALDRLEARREADRALEATLESLRSGAVPVADSHRSWPAAVADGLVVTVASRCQRPQVGLYRVELAAVYTVRRQPVRRSLETFVWRPDECPPVAG